MKEKIQIIRSHRKTLSLEITSCGELRVRAPYLMAEREILRFVDGKSDWIARHLQKLEADKDDFRTEGRFTEEEKLSWLRQILEWQQSSDNQEFLSLLKGGLDLFAEDVYCFTPNGDVKNLICALYLSQR